MPINSELVANLLKAPADSKVSAETLRYDPRIAAIAEARREQSYPPRTQTDPPLKLPDWNVVVSTTTAMLSEVKDLQLAAWLTEGLAYRNGLGGLATGIEVVRGLIDQFWDTVHPLPEDGDFELRIGPLDFVGKYLVLPTRKAPWGTTGISYYQFETSRTVPTEADAEADAEKRERREELIGEGKPKPEAVDAIIEGMTKGAVREVLGDIETSLVALLALEKSSNARFEEEGPSFLPLRTTLDEVKRFLLARLAVKLEADPDPVEVANESADGTGVSDGPLTPEPTNRADATQRLAVSARWLRQQEPTNPAPYLLLRGFRWGELRVSAPDIDAKLLEAPPTALRTRIKTLALDGKWPELLEQCELLMATAQGRGWLDLQRYTLSALNELGGSYDAVTSAVRGALRQLLTDLPTLAGMMLMDDTPTANEETRAWLQKDGLLTPAPVEQSEGSRDTQETTSSDGSESLSDALDDDAASAHQGGFSRTQSVRRTPRGRDVFDTARSELSAGRPKRAVELLMTELARDQSPRGRFVRQTQIAYVMVEAGLNAVAQPILERLIEVIDERTLDQWESGPLVAQPMALLCRVLDRSGEDADRRQALYLRVCRLDPLQALAIQTS